MAVNPMQRKARNSFLLGMVISLLITGIVIIILFLQLKKVTDEQAAEKALRASVYKLNQDVTSGQVLTEDMFKLEEVNKTLIPENATSVMEVIDTWYLQTKDGMAVKRYGEELYLPTGDKIVEVTKEEGKYYRVVNGEKEEVTLRAEPYSDELEGEVQYYVIDNSEVDQETKIYLDKVTNNYYKYKLGESKERVREYIELNNVPVLAKVNMKANTIITRDLVVQSDAIVTDDVRKQEYNMIVLPVDLETNDYVDIRLMLPSGQDFIVVSKAQVTIPVNGDGTYVYDTISIDLREDEILSMSNAIVEAYGVLGSKLYATKYAEPGMQKSSLPTYTPNEATASLINNNPNIVSLAATELNARNSATGLRNQYINSQVQNSESYKENIEEYMQNDIISTDAARKLYLETLGM